MISRLQWPLAVLLLVLGRAAALKGDDNKGSGFTYPVEEGLTFYEKDSVNVSWTSKFNTASLLVFCWEGDNDDILTQKNSWNDVPGNNGSKIVFIDFETTADRCWFNLRDNDKDSQDGGVNSAGFSLSATERSQTTLGLQGEATTTVAVSATSTIATTTSSETVQSTESEKPTDTAAGSNSDSSDSGGGLSSGAKAGIGIGVALGVVGILALGGAFWLIKRRRNGANQTAPVEKDGNGVVGYQQPKLHELPSGATVPHVPQGPPQELPG